MAHNQRAYEMIKGKVEETGAPVNADMVRLALGTPANQRAVEMVKEKLPPA